MLLCYQITCSAWGCWWRHQTWQLRIRALIGRIRPMCARWRAHSIAFRFRRSFQDEGVRNVTMLNLMFRESIRRWKTTISVRSYWHCMRSPLGRSPTSSMWCIMYLPWEILGNVNCQFFLELKLEKYPTATHIPDESVTESVEKQAKKKCEKYIGQAALLLVKQNAKGNSKGNAKGNAKGKGKSRNSGKGEESDQDKRDRKCQPTSDNCHKIGNINLSGSSRKHGEPPIPKAFSKSPATIDTITAAQVQANTIDCSVDWSPVNLICIWNIEQGWPDMCGWQVGLLRCLDIE